MTEREALLKAVCDSPDDDTPRLVFADWLQENGEEERAEFIRLQVRLHRGNFWPSEEARLKRRLKKLNVHIERWQREIPKAEHIFFRRGFIQRACLLDGGDVEAALLAAPIEYLWVRGPVDLLAIMNVPHLTRLGCLDLNGATIRTADVEEFLTRKWTSHPGRLELPLPAEISHLRDHALAKFEWVWISPF